MSMPEPGETWKERIPDEGSFCDASQVVSLMVTWCASYNKHCIYVATSWATGNTNEQQ